MSIQIEINLEKYPMLEKFKVKDRNKIIHQIIDIGYNILYPEFDKKQLENLQKDNTQFNSIVDLMNTNMSTLSEKIELSSAKNKIDELSSVITKLTGISNTSNKKGELSEKIVEQIFQTKFPGLTYEQTRHVAHSGDGRLHFPENFDVLVEIKNYSNTVNPDEVEKFCNDMKFTNLTFGIFISIQTPIRGISNFDYKQFLHNNQVYHQIFIGCLNQNYDLLNASIMMIRQLFKIQSGNMEVLNLFQNQVNGYFQEMLDLYEKNKQLRQHFYDMETNVKQSLSTYYCHLRENQVELENKIKQVHNKINQTIDSHKNKLESTGPTELLTILKTKKYWGFEYISKLFDNVVKHKCKLSGTNDTYYIANKNMTCEIKLQNQKIIFNLNEPCITFVIEKKNKANDETLKSFNKFFFV